MKNLSLPLLLTLAVTSCTAAILSGCSSPPSDEVLMKNFVDKKPLYENLRDLLVTDDRVRLVAAWGIETTASPVSVQPPVAELSLDRYQRYLALLRDIDGKAVGRSDDGLCVLVWSDGFAGETRHEAVCWLDKPPRGQVARLDQIEEQSVGAGKRATVYRHVETKWYLQRDE